MYKVLASLFILLLCTAGTAHALQGFYIAPKLGYSILRFEDPEIDNFGFSNEDDQVFGGGLALGYDMRRMEGMVPLRFEVEGFWRERGDNNWVVAGEGTVNNRVEVGTLFANVYFDIPLGWVITPYIGGGLGMSWLDYRTRLSATENGNGPLTVEGSDDSWEFAWNVGAGIAWFMTESIALDFNYRYVDAGEASTNIEGFNSQADIILHEFLLGLRFTF
jgi:opacity protein-like surface antigen